MSSHRSSVRTTRDVVLAVPALLGYWPGSSICLVLLDRHGAVDVLARWDAPGDPTDDASLREAVSCAASAYLVVTDPARERRPGQWVDVLPPAIAARLPLRDVVVVCARDGDLDWRSRLDPTPMSCTLAEAFAAAQAQGLAPWAASRDEYVADIEPVAEFQRTVADRVAAAAAVTEATRDVAILQAVEWLTSEMPIELDRIADVIVALSDVAVRDTVLWELLHADAQRWPHMADRLAQAVAASPDDVAAPVASVLAILRWQSGDGSRAWAALERALSATPSYSLATLVGSCLVAGMHPATWRAGMASLTREECRQRTVTTPG